MSRIFDFTIAGVIVIIAAVIHRAALELFAPESPLHEIASDGTGVLNGAQRADLWFEILAIWVPILTIGGIIAWIFLREYRRQVATAVRRP